MFKLTEMLEDSTRFEKIQKKIRLDDWSDWIDLNFRFKLLVQSFDSNFRFRLLVLLGLFIIKQVRDFKA